MNTAGCARTLHVVHMGGIHPAESQPCPVDAPPPLSYASASGRRSCDALPIPQTVFNAYRVDSVFGWAEDGR